MSYDIKSLDQLDVSGKRVLLRVDYNVPLDEHLRVTDTTRIEASKPTVEKILAEGGSIVLLSHLGRPEGVEPCLSLRHIVVELSKAIGVQVIFGGDATGVRAKLEASKLKPGQVLLLENLRFHPGELRDSISFARTLADLGDLYVNDAFATAHRAHASTVALARLFPAKRAAGYLLLRELKAIDRVLVSGEKPVTAIIGGAKVSSKIATLQNLLPKLDNLIIGGGMAYTFIKASGGAIGDSIYEPDQAATAQRILEQAKSLGCNLLLPLDVIAADRFSDQAERMQVDSHAIPPAWQGLDAGPETLSRIKTVISSSKTILWNGPLGVFEFPNFSQGTLSLANCVAQATSSGAFSLVGGGDSVAAVKRFGLYDRISLVSTGGGAMLACLEGETLPAVAALERSR